MIIGIDATRANKPQKTGVEWYSYHLIRAIAKQHTKHTYRLYFNTEPEEGLRDLGPNIQYRMLKWPLPYLWTQIRLAWEMLVDPPDVLFIPAQIVPFIHPANTVTTIHDVAFKPYPKSYSVKSRFYLNLAAVLASKLPALITISDFSKREIIKYYQPPEDRIHVIPLGFKHEETEPSPMILTKHDIRDPYFVSIGRLERKKNTKVMIETFNAIKDTDWGRDYQFVLIGAKGHGWVEIERVINKSPYKSDIKLVGWVSEAEKHSILSEAKALMMISAYEGFGLPLLEAMHAETPIVTSDQASLPEVVGNAGIITPRGNTKRLVQALYDISHDETLRNKLVAAGKERVLRYTWEHTARETMNILEDLLPKKKPDVTPPTDI